MPFELEVIGYFGEKKIFKVDIELLFNPKYTSEEKASRIAGHTYTAALLWLRKEEEENAKRKNRDQRPRSL